MDGSEMSKPDAWLNTDDGDVIPREGYARYGNTWVPLYAIDDETREAFKVAVVYLNDALADSDYAGDTPDEAVREMWRTNSAALRKHIAALERLVGEGE